MHNSLKHGDFKKNLLVLLLGVSSLVFTAKPAGSPLVQAIRDKQDVLAVQQLIEGGADVNEAGSDGLTPLMAAALAFKQDEPNFAEDMVRMLLAHKPNVDTASPLSGSTALHFALSKHRIGVATLLVNGGADVNAADKGGETPLLIATRFNGDVDVHLVSLLVAKGARVGFKTEEGKTALDYLREERKSGDGNDTAMIQILQEGLAVQAGNRALANTQLEIDPWDTNWVVQLIKEAKLSDDAIKSFLKQNHSLYDSWRARIAAGEANVTSRSHIPLIEAIWRGADEAVIKKLLDLGVDVNDADLNGSTPLMNAAYQGKEKLVKDFLARGANPYVSDDNGDTALIFAVETHVSLAVVQALIAAGTPVNAVNKQGKSALIEAVSYSHIGGDNSVEAVRLLLAAGARVDLRTNFVEYGHFFKTRKTALDYAKEKGSAEVIALLETADREQAKTRPSMLQRFWRWLEEDVERG